MPVTLLTAIVLPEKRKVLVVMATRLHDYEQHFANTQHGLYAMYALDLQVVMALLLKQETIEKPHKCHCPCKDCLDAARLDELKFARSRLNAYRALSSEAYISLSSDDPILTSFRLRRELQQVADEEKYYTVWRPPAVTITVTVDDYC